jgi:hypothetical protein
MTTQVLYTTDAGIRVSRFPQVVSKFSVPIQDNPGSVVGEGNDTFARGEGTPVPAPVFARGEGATAVMVYARGEGTQPPPPPPPSSSLGIVFARGEGGDSFSMVFARG